MQKGQGCTSAESLRLRRHGRLGLADKKVHKGIGKTDIYKDHCSRELAAQ